MFDNPGHPLAGTDLRPAEINDRTEAQWQAMVDAQIAADPHPWPEVDPAEVAARTTALLMEGETDAVTPGLVASVWDLDPRVLDRDDRIGLTTGWDRIVNAVTARRGRSRGCHRRGDASRGQLALF